jgi:exocyst complex component 2
LSNSDDPTWVYFDSQHRHVLDELNKAYKAGCDKVEGMLVDAGAEKRHIDATM